jgi:flagellar basal-body rod modification protein FlgD
MAITTSAVNAATTAASSAATGASAVTSAAYGNAKDLFLKLFVKQLQTQDPMSPMDSNQFTSQLAQMTQVEQLTDLNNNFASFLRSQELANASGMIGSTVTYKDATTGATKTGTVTAARLADNEVKLVVGQDLVKLSQVTDVARP